MMHYYSHALHIFLTACVPADHPAWTSLEYVCLVSKPVDKIDIFSGQITLEPLRQNAISDVLNIRTRKPPEKLFLNLFI